MQFAGRGQGRPGGIRVLDRRAEDTQRRVALELVDEPAVLEHGVDHDPEELVEQPDDLGRRSGGGKLGGPDEVDEQHRDVALLAAEFGSAFQRAAGDVLAHVASEQIPHALTLAEFADHVVEARLQQAELGGVVDLHVSVVVAALHLPERPPELAQRVGDRHRREHIAGQADDQRRDGHQQNRCEQSVGRGVHHGQPQLAGRDRHDDHEQRDTGGEHPGQDQPQHHAGPAEVLRHTLAKCGHRDRPQHPFGLQVADDRGSGGAGQGGHGQFGGGVARDRPAGADEHDRADHPQHDADRRSVGGHA